MLDNSATESNFEIGSKRLIITPNKKAGQKSIEINTFSYINKQRIGCYYQYDTRIETTSTILIYSTKRRKITEFPITITDLSNRIASKQLPEFIKHRENLIEVYRKRYYDRLNKNEDLDSINCENNPHI